MKLIFYYCKDLWRDPAKRKKFFENYAKENGFDSMNPDEWYKQNRAAIMASKVIIIYYYFFEINYYLF